MTITEQKFGVLQNTDLNKYVKSPREKFVIGCLQYRNCKTNYALEKIKPLWENMFAKPTASFYFGEILRYHATGMTILSTEYKCLIDKHRKIEPLPVDGDNARRLLKRRGEKGTKIDVPVARKAVTKPIENTEVVEKFNYGIRFNGCCMMTFENEMLQNMFIKGLEMAKLIKDYKKIHVKPDAITEVE